MKRKLMRLLACILIIGFALPTAGEIVAFADNEEADAGESAPYSAPAPEAPVVPTTTGTTVITGEGTPESPKLTETTVTEVDTETGDTTVTVTGEKEWKSEDESVTGSESGEASETRDTDDKLIKTEGTVDGSETVVNETHSQDNSDDEVTIINGTGTTEDGKTINSDVPDVTLELTPGQTDSESKEAKAWFDDSTLNLPSWVRSESDGKTTWAEPSHSENNGVTDDISVSTVTDDTTGTKTDTYTRTVVGADGKTVREVVTCKRNSRGYITDYSVETYEIESITTESTALPDNASAPSGEGSKTYGFELPEKPTVPEPSYAPDGSVENGQIVAELCDASGNVVGYTVVTVKNGTVVGYGEPVLGRYCVTETTVEPLENGLKKRTTTKTYTTSVKHSAQSGSVGSGTRTVDGWMDENVTGKVEKSDVKTYVPYLKNDHKGTIDTDRDLGNCPNEEDYADRADLYIRWRGEYGIESSIRVNQNNGNYRAHQFVLEDKAGNKYYVYCCDFDVEPKTGADYNVQRLEDASYYKNNNNGKAQDQIRAIVLNGYWGVENTSTDSDAPTPGSLAAFRKMLVDANVLTADDADKITDGMALTATQAAIWYYGNSGKSLLSDSEITGKSKNEKGFEETAQYKKDIINKAYAYLIKNLPGVSATQDNTLLKPEDFKFADSLTLKVGKQVGNQNDETKYYCTDITFTMAVKPDAENGDLIIYITDAEGKTIGAYRLCGNTENDETNGINSVTINPDGSYTLSGVNLPAGSDVNLNLNLKGTQKLNNGVYLFNCTTGADRSQTFIGCGGVTQNVDIKVKFGFNVTDPAVALKALAQATSSEVHDWSSEFYSFDDGGSDRSGGGGGGDSDGGNGGGGRSSDVPKTCDGMLAVQVALALGAALSLAGTALFLARALKREA